MSFYEKECLPYVKRIAGDINKLAEWGFTDREDAIRYFTDIGENMEHDAEMKAEYEALKEMIDTEEPLSLYDYFDDCLDIEYRINGQGEYRNVQIAVTLGGPNIYVNTETATVNLYWGGEKAEAYLSQDARDQIDEIFAEIYDSL